MALHIHMMFMRLLMTLTPKPRLLPLLLHRQLRLGNGWRRHALVAQQIDNLVEHSRVGGTHGGAETVERLALRLVQEALDSSADAGVAGILHDSARNLLTRHVLSLNRLH